MNSFNWFMHDLCGERHSKFCYDRREWHNILRGGINGLWYYLNQINSINKRETWNYVIVCTPVRDGFAVVRKLDIDFKCIHYINAYPSYYCDIVCIFDCLCERWLPERNLGWYDFVMTFSNKIKTMARIVELYGNPYRLLLKINLFSPPYSGQISEKLIKNLIL